MFGFFKKKRNYLDVPVDKREKAHQMLDKIIDESDYLSSYNMTYNLNKYIEGLKTVYAFKEILE